MEEEEQQKQDWHLQKNFAMSIIFLLITQTASGIWWAASITSEVDNLKSGDIVERVIKLESRLDEQGRILIRLDTTLNKLDATIAKVNDTVTRRESTIDRVEDFLKEKNK